MPKKNNRKNMSTKNKGNTPVSTRSDADKSSVPVVSTDKKSVEDRKDDHINHGVVADEEYIGMDDVISSKKKKKMTIRSYTNADLTNNNVSTQVDSEEVVSDEESDSIDTEELMKDTDSDSFETTDSDSFSDSDTELNELLKEKGQPVFQVQCKKKKDGTFCTFLMEVGRFIDVSDVVINEFDINTRIKCIIVSSIFIREHLVQISKDCRFNMIKIIVNYRNKKKFHPICCMMLNFNFFDHVKTDKCITEYISSKTNRINLHGYFSITFHYTDRNDKDKCMILKTYKKYIGNIPMLDTMIHCMATDTVQHIIADSIKMIKH